MKLTKCIKDGQWDALFDELDADKNGALAHSEFWAKMALKNSSNMIDALDQFDVSFIKDVLVQESREGLLKPL